MGPVSGGGKGEKQVRARRRMLIKQTLGIARPVLRRANSWEKSLREKKKDELKKEEK